MEGRASATPGWQWALALTAMALFIFRYGYGFGFSDQDEFLPLVSFLLDSDAFQSDWFVSMQTDGFSIRWPIAVLIALPGTFLPVWVAVLGWQLLTGLGSALAVIRLSYRIFGNALAAATSVVAVLVLTTRWNPGGNDVLHAMLVPSSVAWCLILWAIVRMHERRALASGTLLGLATLFHPLLGLQAGGLLLLISASLPNWPWKAWWKQALPFLVVLLPLVVLLSSVGTSTEEATLILTHIRAPHHYLPEAFSTVAWIKFVVLLLVAGIVLSRDVLPDISRSSELASVPLTRWDRALMGRLVLIPTAVLLASLLVTAWPFEWGTALRLQPWAISPMVRVMTALIAAGYAASWIHARISGPAIIRTALDGRLINTLAPALAVMFILMAFSGKGDAIRGIGSPDQELFDWAAENTAETAVFVIPPSMTGFQYGSQRAQYVSFKSFPFAPEPTLEWLDRLHRIAPTEDLPGGTALLARLDSAYAAQSVADMRLFAAEAAIDYIVRPVTDPAGWESALRPEWCGEQWCVYWAGRILTQPVRPPAS